MRREELLRRLEERLARGEISEETYREIKARYDALPDEPEPPEPPEPPAGPPLGLKALDVLDVVDEAVERVMEQVGRRLEEALGTEELHTRMEAVSERVREAMKQVGTRVEAGGRRIVISGSGVVATDTPVDTFRCSGSGKVEGDLRATEVKISGACKIAGACICEEFKASGSVKVGEGVTAGEFHSSGSVKVGADLKAREVATSGALAVAGSILEAQEVKVSGKLLVEGWVRTQEFRSEGRFEIGEGLEAQEVQIRLAGSSRVPVIRAQEVRVEGGRWRGELVADRVEADEAYLEATRAGLVRGRKVRIGAYSNVDVVEADELEVHETATVRQRKPREPSSVSEEHGDEE